MLQSKNHLRCVPIIYAYHVFCLPVSSRRSNDGKSRGPKDREYKPYEIINTMYAIIMLLQVLGRESRTENLTAEMNEGPRRAPIRVVSSKDQ